MHCNKCGLQYSSYCVEKICETNSAQGEKLKQIAQNFLSNTIANLN